MHIIQGVKQLKTALSQFSVALRENQLDLTPEIKGLERRFIKLLQYKRAQAGVNQDVTVSFGSLPSLLVTGTYILTVDAKELSQGQFVQRQFSVGVGSGSLITTPTLLAASLRDSILDLKTKTSIPFTASVVGPVLKITSQGTPAGSNPLQVLFSDPNVAINPNATANVAPQGQFEQVKQEVSGAVAGVQYDAIDIHVFADEDLSVGYKKGQVEIHHRIFVPTVGTSAFALDQRNWLESVIKHFGGLLGVTSGIDAIQVVSSGSASVTSSHIPIGARMAEVTGSISPNDTVFMDEGESSGIQKVVTLKTAAQVYKVRLLGTEKMHESGVAGGIIAIPLGTASTKQISMFIKRNVATWEGFNHADDGVIANASAMPASA